MEQWQWLYGVEAPLHCCCSLQHLILIVSFLQDPLCFSKWGPALFEGPGPLSVIIFHACAYNPAENPSAENVSTHEPGLQGCARLVMNIYRMKQKHSKLKAKLTLPTEPLFIGEAIREDGGARGCNFSHMWNKFMYPEIKISRAPDWKHSQSPRPKQSSSC